MSSRTTADGAAIRAIREARGITLRDLATETSYNPGHVSRVERGLHGGSEAFVQEVARALGVNARALTARSPAEPDDSDAIDQKGATACPICRQVISTVDDHDIEAHLEWANKEIDSAWASARDHLETVLDDMTTRTERTEGEIAELKARLTRLEAWARRNVSMPPHRSGKPRSTGPSG